jgi:hypothetical protein
MKDFDLHPIPGWAAVKGAVEKDSSINPSLYKELAPKIEVFILFLGPKPSRVIG